jgi:hypothetical protein
MGTYREPGRLFKFFFVSAIFLFFFYSTTIVMILMYGLDWALLNY